MAGPKLSFIWSFTGLEGNIGCQILGGGGGGLDQLLYTRKFFNNYDPHIYTALW